MISFDIGIETEDWNSLDLETILEKCSSCLAAVAPQGLCPSEVSILFTSDDAVQILNRDWRGKDKPTNVLSFPADDMPILEGTPALLGDIALAYETCTREAVEKKITVSDHLTHLILHGILHLIGYDHISEEDAVEMETLERQLLERLEIADPYGSAQDGESDA